MEVAQPNKDIDLTSKLACAVLFSQNAIKMHTLVCTTCFITDELCISLISSVLYVFSVVLTLDNYYFPKQY
jgi:hypothetical protein